MNEVEQNLPIGCIRRLTKLLNRLDLNDEDLIYSRGSTEQDIQTVHDWVHNKDGVKLNITIK